MAIVAREVMNAPSVVVGAVTINAIAIVAASARARLLYAMMRIANVEVEAMVDIGASHLFVSEHMEVKL